MIQNVTVDYGAGGMPEIMKGGVPAAVTLTITFSEIQIQTAQDYGADEPIVEAAVKQDFAAAGEASGTNATTPNATPTNVNSGGTPGAF